MVAGPGFAPGTSTLILDCSSPMSVASYLAALPRNPKLEPEYEASSPGLLKTHPDTNKGINSDILKEQSQSHINTTKETQTVKPQNWSSRADSNGQPHPYKERALTN